MIDAGQIEMAEASVGVVAGEGGAQGRQTALIRFFDGLTPREVLAIVLWWRLLCSSGDLANRIYDRLKGRIDQGGLFDDSESSYYRGILDGLEVAAAGDA